MLQNYILTAWRGARRDISGFLINIIGLLVGFTVFTLAFSFAHYLGGFDTSFMRAERTYSVGLKLTPGNFFRRDSIPFAFTGAIDGLKERTSDVELAGRVISGRSSYLKDGEFLPLQYRAVDTETLSIFDVELTRGSLTSFSDKLEVALVSEREARHLFGDADPIGQTLDLNGTHTVAVVGVFKDLPANTHLMVNPNERSAFDFLVPIGFYEKLEDQQIVNGWESIDSSVASYVVAKNGVSQSQLEITLTNHLLANIDEQDQQNFQGLTAQPINEMQGAALAVEGINPAVLVRLIGLLILGLAVLNAISLASARMINRSREIGLRRVFGARKSELTFQFITENTVYALLALLASVLLAFDLFDWIREATGMDLQFTNMLDAQLAAGLVFAAIIVGLVSSFYPILLFSGVLKNVSLNRTLTLATSSAWLRKVLVAFQFTVVSGLVLAFFVMQLQNQHLLNNVHKVETNRMAAITGLWAPGMSETVAQTVKTLPGVESVSRNGLPPYGGNTNINIMNIQGVGESVQFRMIAADHNYFKQLGVDLLAGRMLDETRDMDYVTREESRDETLPLNFVVNEAAMQLLGFSNPADIVGHTFVELNTGENQSSAERHIVGVAPNLRLGLPTEELMPTLYWISERRLNALTILYSEEAPIDVAALNRAWQAVDPSAMVRVRPIADMATNALMPFNTVNRLFIAITVITVTMAAAGLYALTAYLAAGKKREVSIRKVHGAPIRHILRRLMWQFTKPVALAMVLGLPVTFYFLQTGYLTMFAERISLNAIPVIATIGLVLLMAWATTFAHVLKAARSRPAVVLRSE